VELYDTQAALGCGRVPAVGGPDAGFSSSHAIRPSVEEDGKPILIIVPP
jgi:hypothetical protein